ncbi:MAG TPA: hypothetical protein VN643_16860 [Pyrinomonadaceae bacterium]|nr:hypothetical protein [Pyrinomonadaceae bacterium]
MPLRKVSRFYKQQPIRAVFITVIVVLGGILISLSFLAGAQGLSFESFLLSIIRWETDLEGFSAQQWISLITPAVLLVTAAVAHAVDGRKNGRGIRHLTTEMGGRAYNLETDVISASMTKQSVLATIASILAIVIQAFFREQSGYLRLVSALSTAGFLLTILLLLVSMVCYDYASRFNWDATEKADLVGKALYLDIWSWYFLLTSFVLAVALLNPRLSTILSVFAGILMWWYYFFRMANAGVRLPIRGLHLEINVSDLSAACAFYHSKLGFAIGSLDNHKAELEVGSWGRITLVHSTQSFPAQNVIFTIPAELLIDAQNILSHQGITATATSSSEVTFTDPYNHCLCLRTIETSKKRTKEGKPKTNAVKN